MITATIHYVEFPEVCRGQVGGMTKLQDDGNFLIAIDSALSEGEQNRLKNHELAHILLDHFFSDDRCVKDLENEADLFAAHRMKMSEYYASSLCKKE